ncbi:MAG: hypothetical protein JWR38_171 [Mucilaginibacter sp.]|nr:hypothetical protein [Mucilaginibacter sp.]
MMDHKYELEDKCDLRPEYGMHALFSILTGLPYNDIDIYFKPGKRLYGRDIIQILQRMRFNINPGFIKFDRATVYPCLLRCTKANSKRYQYFVYYDDKVYAPHQGGTYAYQDWFAEQNDDYKIHSMLQVWV